MDGLEWLSDYVVGFMKSPTWVVPIAQYVDDRCGLFDDDGGENKLEYTACHQEFGQLVGDLLAAHLLEVSVTPEMFDHFCQQGLNENQELHRVLIEQLLSVDDFLTFKAMMAKQNAELYREVVTLDAEGGFEGEEPMSPTREVASQLVRDALDISEWRLYEEQLFSSAENPHRSEEADEASRRCEEAELQHAIALSLQFEEERLRQDAPSLNSSLRQPLAEQLGCSAYLPLSLQMREEAGAPTSAATGFPSMETAPVFAALGVQQHQVAATLPRPPMPLTGGFTSAPLMSLPLRPPAVQHLVRVEPLSAAPRPQDFPQAAVAADPQVKALRVRAERALAPLPTGPSSPKRAHQVVDQFSSVPSWPASAPPVPAHVALAAAAASAASAGGPTVEERQRRAEHLRNQRDRLLQKRRNDRGHTLTHAISAGGRSSHVAAAVDRALQSSGTSAAGRRMLAELAPACPPPSRPDAAAAAAEQMRQALTVQLRQNLARSTAEVGTEAVLSNQLDRLEHMQASGRA